MGTSRGIDRLATFNDAIVAIAITLLILPLVDAASEIGSQPVGDFLRENQQALFAFFLSWIVIAVFWRVQHSLLERLVGYTPGLRNAILMWCLAVVFLPFPTELLSAVDKEQSGTDLIYIGTLLFASVALLIEEVIITRAPALVEAGQQVPRPLAGGVSTMLLAVAFLVALIFPGVGLWALLLLVLDAPISRLVPQLR